MTDHIETNSATGKMDHERLNEEANAPKGCGEADRSYGKELTVCVELQGEESITTTELMKNVRELCGGLLACRTTGDRRYELTMSHQRGKDRLLEGFKIGEVRIIARELRNDEMVVSFLNLPAYITDDEILGKLHGWGVSATSPIKRRMWPGTRIADGTRFMRVKFNKLVQSLPYSAKFHTAIGPEYFRVIHDRQSKVCRLCIQPGHILRECPEFFCRKCGLQGHFARECKSAKKCDLCHNTWNECDCNKSEEDGGAPLGTTAASTDRQGELHSEDENKMETETGQADVRDETQPAVAGSMNQASEVRLDLSYDPDEESGARRGARLKAEVGGEVLALGVGPIPAPTPLLLKQIRDPASEMGMMNRSSSQSQPLQRLPLDNPISSASEAESEIDMSHMNRIGKRLSEKQMRRRSKRNKDRVNN